LNVGLEDLANSGADFLPDALSHGSDLRESKQIDEHSKTKFIAFKVPFKSSIEVPDPNAIVEHYRALGCDEDMIKAYRLNINITKQDLPFSGNLLLVSRKDASSCLINENPIFEQNAKQFYVI
jgi:hypothetical protein